MVVRPLHRNLDYNRKAKEELQLICAMRNAVVVCMRIGRKLALLGLLSCGGYKFHNPHAAHYFVTPIGAALRF